MSGPTIESFDRLQATDEDFASYNELSNTIKKESLPDDPPTPLEQTKLELQNVPPIYDLHLWVARDGDRMVGRADLGIPRMQTNNHLVQFDIRILPEYRRHGLGTRFLEHIVRLTRDEDRKLMISATRSTIPAGERFMEALGGNVGLATHVNDLRTDEVDRDLLRQWIDRAAERGHGFELGLWEGSYPEAELEAIAEMRQLINTMPTDTLDVEDFIWTPEELRKIDETMSARGDRRCSFYVRELSSSKLVGYTELSWNPMEPKMAHQLDTAVFEEFKNRGFGRWLKAAMLEKLLRERPEVELVRTGNAQSNAPMLKINTELGFRPSMTEIIWQVATEGVEKYLASRLTASAS
jgi:GNAT superfamily N-acetyltransferase